MNLKSQEGAGDFPLKMKLRRGSNMCQSSLVNSISGIKWVKFG